MPWAENGFFCALRLAISFNWFPTVVWVCFFFQNFPNRLDNANAWDAAHLTGVDWNDPKTKKKALEATIPRRWRHEFHTFWAVYKQLGKTSRENNSITLIGVYQMEWISNDSADKLKSIEIF